MSGCSWWCTPSRGRSGCSPPPPAPRSSSRHGSRSSGRRRGGSPRGRRGRVHCVTGPMTGCRPCQGWPGGGAPATVTSSGRSGRPERPALEIRHMMRGAERAGCSSAAQLSQGFIPWPVLLVTWDLQGLRILRTRHKSDQVRGAGLAQPGHRVPVSSGVRKHSGSGSDQARPDLNRNQSESNLGAGIQVANDDLSSLSGSFQCYFLSNLWQILCMITLITDNLTIGWNVASDQNVVALPRTLSTSVLRIKHRRSFWEKFLK